MSTIEFWLGVLASLLATMIWTVIKWSISFPFSIYYPKIIGTWEGVYSENGEEYKERIIVEKQNFKYSSGRFYSYENELVFKYLFKAEFIENRVLHVRFWPVDKDIQDHGTAIFELNISATEFEGGSVSYNFQNRRIEARAYKMIKIVQR